MRDKEHAKSAMAFLHKRVNDIGLFVEAGEAGPTVEALRFGTETLRRLESVPLPRTLSAGGEFVYACRRDGGGFATNPHAVSPQLSSTYYAVRLHRAGNIAGKLEHLDNVSEWVRSQLLNGAYLQPGIDIDELYYGVRTLQLLSASALDRQLMAVVISHIDECHGKQGGFSRVPADEPDVERTYVCLHMLSTFSALKEHALDTSWLSSCIRDGGVYWNPTCQVQFPATFYWGLRAAEILDIRVPWEKMIPAVMAFKNGDGGFGRTETSELWHTYCGVNVCAMATEGGCRDAITA